MGMFDMEDACREIHNIKNRIKTLEDKLCQRRADVDDAEKKYRERNNEVEKIERELERQNVYIRTAKRRLNNRNRSRSFCRKNGFVDDFPQTTGEIDMDSFLEMIKKKEDLEKRIQVSGLDMLEKNLQNARARVKETENKINEEQKNLNIIEDRIKAAKEEASA